MLPVEAFDGELDPDLGGSGKGTFGANSARGTGERGRESGISPLLTEDTVGDKTLALEEDR